MAADSIRAPALAVSLLTACANADLAATEASLLTACSNAAHLEATEASFAEERFENFLSVLKQRKDARDTVKKYCAQAAREAFKSKQNGTLQTESKKKKRKNKVVVRTPVSLVHSLSSEHGDSHIHPVHQSQLTKESNSIMAENSSRAQGLPVPLLTACANAAHLAAPEASSMARKFEKMFRRAQQFESYHSLEQSPGSEHDDIHIHPVHQTQLEKESTSLMADNSSRAQGLPVPLLTACANAAHMAAPEASSIVRKFAEIFRKVQQLQSAPSLEQSPGSKHDDIHIHPVHQTQLEKESTSLTAKNSSRAQGPVPLLTACANAAHLAAFTAKIDNPLPGSAAPFPLCERMQSSTGKWKAILVKLVLDCHLLRYCLYVLVCHFNLLSLQSLVQHRNIGCCILTVKVVVCQSA